MKKLNKTIIFTIFIALFIGCGKKTSSDLYNLAPSVWYSKIIEDIQNANLKEADKAYTLFTSEHISNPLLEPLTLILVQAHIDEEHYAKANEYLDIYIKRFGTPKKIEYARFLKIKANFDSFSSPNRNQVLIQNSIAEIKKFIQSYPDSEFRPLIDTMLVKFQLAQFELNKAIENLYQRTGREKSAKIYQERLEKSNLEDTKIIPAQLPWYRRIFE